MIAWVPIQVEDEGAGDSSGNEGDNQVGGVRAGNGIPIFDLIMGRWGGGPYTVQAKYRQRHMSGLKFGLCNRGCIGIK